MLAPSLLVLLGVGVIVSAVRDDGTGGLVGLAVAAGAVLGVVAVTGAVLDVPFRGGVGERLHHPTASTDVQQEYRLLVGSQVVDLRDVVLGPGTTTIEVSTVLGEVRVTR